jgi:hypothetical protein
MSVVRYFCAFFERCVRSKMPNLFTVIGLPFLIVAMAVAYLVYVRIVRPSPVALGSVIPKVCVVSADEIFEYCASNDENDIRVLHRSQETRWAQARIANKYIGQMTWNTRLIQQVVRFEQLKIDPLKSSLDYETRETLVLRLADEAAAVRWLLVKSRIALLTRIFSTSEIRAYAVGKLQESIREYKRLEFDTVSLVGMAKDECYYTMLVERLGLSNWNLIEGDSPAL